MVLVCRPNRSPSRCALAPLLCGFQVLAAAAGGARRGGPGRARQRQDGGLPAPRGSSECGPACCVDALQQRSQAAALAPMLLPFGCACSAPASTMHAFVRPAPPPACPQLLATQGHGAATQPEGPLVLILLPTRELAQQVAGVCRDLRKHSGLRTVCITGGTDKQQQVEALSKQVRINHTHTEPQLGTTIRSSSSCSGSCTGFCTACTVLLVPATHCAARAPRRAARR